MSQIKHQGTERKGEMRGEILETLNLRKNEPGHAAVAGVCHGGRKEWAGNKTETAMTEKEEIETGTTVEIEKIETEEGRGIEREAAGKGTGRGRSHN